MAIVNSYKDKYMGVDGRLSVMEILQKVGSTEYKNGIVKEYQAVDIDKVIIAENTFKNYGQYHFIWEKSFVKQPERSASGAIDNLDAYPTFLTPHLIIDFSVMSIDDYRRIMKLHYSSNEFIVKCYDPIYDETIEEKMYFATEEMAKLYTIAQNRIKDDGSWEEWIDLVGVTEYKVELIGTNNPIDKSELTITYVYTNDTDSATQFPNVSVGAYLGEEIQVGSGVEFTETPPQPNFKFKHWVDAQGVIYSDGNYITVNSNITLYAVWQSASKYILSFNYGLSDVAFEDVNGIQEQIINREVEYGKSIGVLPTLSNPKVNIGGVDYYPYKAGRWRKNPSESSEIVSNYMNFWTTRDTVIYAVYEKKELTVNYDTKFYDITVPTQTAHYGDSVYVPTLIRSGYTFAGWYTSSDYSVKFDGKMPPQDITLHAKWE